MTQLVSIRGGQTYDVGFSVRARGGGGSFGSIIDLRVNGQPIGGGVDTAGQMTWKNGTGVYSRSFGGVVVLSLYNHVSSGDGNDFDIDNIWIRER